MNLAVYGNRLAVLMNDFDFSIKHDVYPQKMHSCSINICGLSLFFFCSKNIRGIYQEKYIIGAIAWVFRS